MNIIGMYEVKARSYGILQDGDDKFLGNNGSALRNSDITLNTGGTSNIELSTLVDTGINYIDFVSNPVRQVVSKIISIDFSDPHSLCTDFLTVNSVTTLATNYIKFDLSLTANITNDNRIIGAIMLGVYNINDTPNNTTGEVEWCEAADQVALYVVNNKLIMRILGTSTRLFQNKIANILLMYTAR